MKKTSLLSMLALAVWVLFAQQVTAQRGGQQTAIGGGFQTAIPVGNFANDYDDTPVGLAFALTAPTWRNSPVHIGFGFAWNTMGSDKQDIYVADGDAFSNASLKVATNKYSYNALARFSPFKGRIQPYIEGIAGMSNYSTKSEISGTYNNGIEYESKDRFQNEVAFNYGWGAGLQIRMAPHVFLDGKVERLQSTATSFINQKELEIDNYGNLDYELIETKPKWMNIQVGLTFKF